MHRAALEGAVWRDLIEHIQAGTKTTIANRRNLPSSKRTVQRILVRCDLHSQPLPVFAFC